MRFGHLALTLSRASALLLLCTTGFASPVTWTLNNVQTVGGLTVTGTFVYDADTNTYSNIDLTASNGKRFTALLKPPSNKTNNNEFLFFPHESPVVVGTSQALGFANAVAKNNRGNAVTLRTASQQGGLFTCSSSNCLDVTPTGDAQWANGGTLVGVPQYPYVDSVSQTSGGAGGGNTVTLSGISFTGTTDVKFGAQSAGAGNFTVVNDTTITVTTPAAAVGPVKVTVTNARGTAAASEAPTYTYFLPTAFNNRIVTSSSTPASITNALTTDVGVEVKGIYNYSAPRSEAATSGLNPRSTYRWALSTVNTGASQANANGANATGNTLGGVAGGRGGITNLNAISYTPVSADLGKYLYYCVTAVSAPVGTAVLGAVGAETCSAAVPVGNPTAGVCGSAASVATATAPAANLCSAFTASAVVGTGGQWGWSCSGIHGGQAASCAAPYASQTLSISANPTSITFGGTSTLTASSTAGLSVALASNANCTLAGTTATGTAAGTCTVTASQAGTGDNGTLRYQAASTQSANITVGKAAQAITGFSANPTSIGVGATSTLSATKGAGSAAVVYGSKTTATCTVTGNTVTAVTAGTCTVAANQAESANHNAAPEVTANLTVTNAAPVASNVAVSGTAQAGVQLTGSYSYSDTESDAQGTSTFRWVRQSNPTADVATTQNYTPVAADVGNALKFCVTPKASAGTATGTEVCSTATANVVAAPANGACGTAASVASATAPAANLCSTGTAGAVNVLGTNWGWSCSGTNGGNANSCTAPFANTNTGGGNSNTTVGAIQAANSNNWQINTAVSGFVALPAPAPAGVSLPGGATKVVLNTGTPGTSTTVTLRFSSIPEGAQLYKYGKENGINDTAKWFAYPATIDRTAGTVTYTLTDGQKGDNDWTVNGVIDDPVGLGVAAAGGAGAGISGVPTLSQWAMLLMGGLVVLGGFGALRRRLG